MIAPAQFLPLIENTGLSVSVGNWVLQHPVADAHAQPRVLDQRQELRRRDHALLRVAPAQQSFEAEHLVVRISTLGWK